MVVRDAARLETGQRGAGSVEMVDAPASEPGAVRFLLGEQPLEAALLRVVVTVLVAEGLERMSGDIRTRLVRDLAEVAERDAVEPHRLVVDVERAPAAVARLHADEPVEAAFDRVVAALELTEREGDDRRVV